MLVIPGDTWISRNDLADILPLHPSDISKYLSKFVQEGYIVSEGNSNAKKYRRHGSLVPSALESEDSLELEPVSVGDQLLSSFDVALQERIREYRKKKRHDKALTEALILAIAKDRWTSLGEFSHLLERKLSVVSRDFIQLMLRHQFLEARFPQKSHPKQEYRSIKT